MEELGALRVLLRLTGRLVQRHKNPLLPPSGLAVRVGLEFIRLWEMLGFKLGVRVGGG